MKACLLSLSGSKAEQEEAALVSEVLSQDLMLTAKGILGATLDPYGEAQLRFGGTWTVLLLLETQCGSH